MIPTHKHPARRDPLRSGRKIVHERWSSPRMFVLAAGGAVIGFNNFWQFPELAVRYGGGAFVAVYLLCVLLLGVPLLMAEFALGRAGKASPIATFRFLAKRVRAVSLWQLVGGMGVLAAFLILSYLSVIAGWVIAFALRAGLGVFAGLTADGLNAQFAQLVRDPEKQLFWHMLFIVMTMVVVGRGVRHGLEAVARFAVPLLLVLLLGLAAYAATTDAFAHAASVLFLPDFDKLSAGGVLAALAQAFFSLGLGAGAMLMYGAYLHADARIPRLSLYVAGIDTATSLVAALAVFALLFAANINPTSGPSLVFQAIPLAFDVLPFGRVMLTLFYVLLIVVAWTSACALAEPTMVWLSERFGMSLRRSTILCGFGAWILGVACLLSFNAWAYPFTFFGAVKRFGFFDTLQVATAQVLLPLAGLLTAVFTGWVLSRDMLRAALPLRPAGLYFLWRWLLRWAIPAMLLIVLLNLPQLYA
jgi:NSS family neurotransmitter:Na+ symporter